MLQWWIKTGVIGTDHSWCSFRKGLVVMAYFPDPPHFRFPSWHQLNILREFESPWGSPAVASASGEGGGEASWQCCREGALEIVKGRRSGGSRVKTPCGSQQHPKPSERQRKLAGAVKPQGICAMGWGHIRVGGGILQGRWNASSISMFAPHTSHPWMIPHWRVYFLATASIQNSDSLFCLACGFQQELSLFCFTISGWIRQVITEAYALMDRNLTFTVKAHSNHSVGTFRALSTGCLFLRNAT